jgi:hypothetical protein
MDNDKQETMTMQPFTTRIEQAIRPIGGARRPARIFFDAA